MACRDYKGDENYPHNRTGGFNFENTKRNEFITKGMAEAASQGSKTALPKSFKTGTTIVGCIFNKGVVLGADTRATSNLVVDKNCEKIHYIAPNIYCCGAGTAADTEATTGQISSQLELLRLNAGQDSRVVTAVTMLKRHLFNYQGHVSAALVLGGVDVSGPHIYTIYPHGSTDKLPFVTMGSGSLAAMSVFESSYKDNLDEEEAKELVCRAIRAGIFNDLGSGSNVDLCVIKKDNQVEMFRGYDKPNEQGDLRKKIKTPRTVFNFPNGTTPTVNSKIEELRGLIVTETVRMDTE